MTLPQSSTESSNESTTLLSPDKVGAIELILDECQAQIAELDPAKGRSFSVLRRAMVIHLERSVRYGDLWKEHGWRGTIYMVIHKAARIKRQFWDQHDVPNPDLDDMFDLINYVIFTVLNIEDGNEHG